MSPAEAIAALDHANQIAGEDVVLRRYLGPLRTNASDVTCRATVREFTANELVDTIAQGDRLAILSPTEATAATWPLPPRKGDKLVIGGRELNIEHPDNITMGGTLVRMNLRVRG
jgi:hypothetical protein